MHAGRAVSSQTERIETRSILFMGTYDETHPTLPPSLHLPSHRHLGLGHGLRHRLMKLWRPRMIKLGRRRTTFRSPHCYRTRHRNPDKLGTSHFYVIWTSVASGRHTEFRHLTTTAIVDGWFGIALSLDFETVEGRTAAELAWTGAGGGVQEGEEESGGGGDEPKRDMHLVVCCVGTLYGGHWRPMSR